MKRKHYRVHISQCALEDTYIDVEAPTRRAAVVTVALMLRAAGGKDIVQGIIEECTKWAVEEMKEGESYGRTN